MTIGIVGGLDRAEPAYRSLAARAGHTAEFHRGDVGGRGAATLGALLRRVELVIVVTDVNSHGSVQLSRRVAKALGVRVLLLRRLSPSRFGVLLQALDAAAAHAAAAHA